MAIRRDFPFYNDQPVVITPMGWAALVASVFVGFYLMTGLVPAILHGVVGDYVGAILFTGVPLLTLHLVSRGHVSALFHRPGLRDFGMAVLFAVLTFVSSVVLALLLSQFFTFSQNPAATAIDSMGVLDLVIFLTRTLIQLLGEELITMLPLLAVIWFCVQKLHLSKGVAIAIALVLTAILFGALHLPTYQWNFVQCFGIIATARIVMTIAYLLTRNLWVSTGAHVMHDWATFLIGFAGSHGPIDPA